MGRDAIVRASFAAVKLDRGRVSMKATDIAEVATAIAALLTFLWSVLKEHGDRQEALQQSRKNLRWRQTVEAQLAAKRIKDDPKASSAMIMLDWTGRRFEIRKGHFAEITWESMRVALRTMSGQFSTLEVFVRDSFDCLLDHFETIQQQIENGIFLLSDVEYPVGYYSQRMMSESNWSVFRDYLDTYVYNGAKKLITEIKKPELQHHDNLENCRDISEQNYDVPATDDSAANSAAAPSFPA